MGVPLTREGDVMGASLLQLRIVNLSYNWKGLMGMFTISDIKTLLLHSVRGSVPVRFLALKHGWSVCHRDWNLFFAQVCSDLDNPGFPESIYVSQWVSKTGGEMFRVETDRFNRRREDFIFLSVCNDRESVIATRGRYAWGEKPYPLTLQERDDWFKPVFFIQWCDWRSLQKLFHEADKGTRRDRILSSYQSVRKRLLFADAAPNAQSGHSTSLCRPKIFRHDEYG